MTDGELIRRFEDRSVEAFHHEHHVRVAWIYLRRLGLHGALGAVSRGLRALSAAHGQQAKYHETISWLYVLVIHQRMLHAPDRATWESFQEANPDLLAPWGEFVGRYYTAETLRSPLARASFVLPDRAISEAPPPPPRSRAGIPRPSPAGH